MQRRHSAESPQTAVRARRRSLCICSSMPGVRVELDPACGVHHQPHGEDRGGALLVQQKEGHQLVGEADEQAGEPEAHEALDGREDAIVHGGPDPSRLWRGEELKLHAGPSRGIQLTRRISRTLWHCAM